ncbi:MAG: ECF transporter S component [Allobaculum sp.]|nr:ECF transporter S component [Allobaculum sp.]
MGSSKLNTKEEKERKRKENVKPVTRMVLAGLFLALGIILPFFTGQIPMIGAMLLPMHIPVLLCGFICGWKYGLAVGLIVPLLRSAMFTMPPMFPQAVAMALELGTYGFVSGWLYEHSKWQCLKAIYRCLIAAMLAGRLVYGLVMALLMASVGQPYSFTMFMTSAFASGIPGIIVQLLLIPSIMAVLNSQGILRYRHIEA